MALPTIKYFGRNDVNNNGLPNPAGFRYKLAIKLSRAVRSQDNNNNPLDIFIEYQRLTRDPQDFIRNVKAIVSDPQDPNNQYFEVPDPNNPGRLVVGFPDKNLKMPIGNSEIITAPFGIKGNATQGGNLLAFPEYVLCTAYIGLFSDDANVFSCHVLTATGP